MYRDIRNPSKMEHVIQVQLRFCVLETSSEQEDNFPPNVVVKVNNKLCPLPVSTISYPFCFATILIIFCLFYIAESHTNKQTRCRAEETSTTCEYHNKCEVIAVGCKSHQCLLVQRIYTSLRCVCIPSKKAIICTASTSYENQRNQTG